MTVVLDTSFAWDCLVDRDPQRHDVAQRCLEQLASGRHGVVVSNDYVYAEATAMAAKFGARSVDAVDRFFLGPDAAVQLHRVDQRLFDEARARLLAGPDRGLSLTDWSLVVQGQRLRAKAVVTFDHRLGRAFGAWLPQ